jgi:hypothetical protein
MGEFILKNHLNIPKYNLLTHLPARL